ncbi:MAG: acyltransferase family protein [Nitratireductor sp.]
MSQVAATHMSSAQSRIGWVDHAKGFCIIFVVMMHSTLGVGNAAGAEGWMHYLVQFAKPFRMPDFFLISGLFLGLVIDRPWRRYLDRKVVHFFYFYVLWLSIQFVFKAPGWMAEGKTPGELASLFAMSFVEPFGTLWFIYMLPVFFVITRLLKRFHWALVLGAAAVLEILPVHTGWLMLDEFAARYVYFLAGYMFASRIFDLSDWAIANHGKALLLLLAWFLGNAFMTFAPMPASLAALSGHEGVTHLSDLPIVSLVLGAAGAIAVIVLTSLLSRIRGTDFLGYLGKNSIVVYLAFFLPMAVSRAILLKFAPYLDIGTISLLVTICGVVGPVILLAVINWTGFGGFLFKRPKWAMIEKPGKTRPGNPVFQPAE